MGASHDKARHGGSEDPRRAVPIEVRRLDPYGARRTKKYRVLVCHKLRRYGRPICGANPMANGAGAQWVSRSLRSGPLRTNDEL